jgi:branched-chain amino acid transport system substrate-binding protein
MSMRRILWVGLILAAIAVTAGVFWRIVRTPSSDPLRIGCITALTTSRGLAMQHGLALAAERINEHGGVHGKPVLVVCEDDQFSTRAGVVGIRKLIDVDKVPVIVTASGTSVTLALAPIAERAHVVLFSSSSSADAIRHAGDYIFRNVSSDKTQGAAAAAFARTHIKADTAAILQRNDDYGIGLATGFASAFERAGGKIVSAASYSSGTADFRDELVKIRDLAPSVAFLPGYDQDTGLILKQARELGITSTFIGSDGSYALRLLDVAGTAAEGSYYTMVTLASRANDRFDAVYKAKFGVESQGYAAYAYDALLTIAQAMRQGGYSGEGIRDALYGVTFNGVTGMTKFDAFGDVAKPWSINEIKHGDFEFVELVEIPAEDH